MTHDDLKAWRKRCGFTQATAADRLGVTRRTYQHWESDSDAPLAKAVELACKQIEGELPCLQNAIP